MLTRRAFLKAFAAGVATVTTPVLYAQASPFSVAEPFVLDMQRRSERYLIDLRSPEGLRGAAWLLRDIRAGDVVGRPNIHTLRLAAWAQAHLAAYGTHTVLDLHSGLRMQSTNTGIEGAARDSCHLPDAYMRFSALDLNPIGINKNVFGNLIAQPRFGGVGWYPTHVHFDVRSAPAYWRRGV